MIAQWLEPQLTIFPRNVLPDCNASERVIPCKKLSHNGHVEGKSVKFGERPTARTAANLGLCPVSGKSRRSGK